MSMSMFSWMTTGPNMVAATDALCWLCLTVLAGASAMTLFNWRFAARMERRPSPARVPADDGAVIQPLVQPLVSLLIPVRNEAENLRSKLTTILQSTYRPLEVIILDDESTDGSHDIAGSILAGAAFPARVVRGSPWSPSSGLSGKAHACAQLADHARGDILIFCDADVISSGLAIQRTVDWLTVPTGRHRTAGVTALPFQSCTGWRERLLIPWIMHLPLMISVPLFCSWRMPVESLQMANGQWIALFACDYFASGGHRKLGATPLEDVALARLVRRATGRGIRPVLAIQDINAAMYQDWQGMLAGFSKNLVAIGGGNPWYFIFLLFLVNVIFLFPLWGWLVRPDLAAVGLALCALIRCVTAVSFKLPLRDVLLHPFSLILLNLAGWKSLRHAFGGSYEWKERVMEWSST